MLSELQKFTKFDNLIKNIFLIYKKTYPITKFNIKLKLTF